MLTNPPAAMKQNPLSAVGAVRVVGFIGAVCVGGVGLRRRSLVLGLVLVRVVVVVVLFLQGVHPLLTIVW